MAHKQSQIKVETLPTQQTIKPTNLKKDITDIHDFMKISQSDESTK